MAAKEPKPYLVANITCHAFNKEGTAIALCPNSNEVWIYETKGDQDFKKWHKTHVLSEHVSNVVSIDWSPITNQIVTCGHDRNAYVWTFKDEKWEPELVILRINRAATSVKWSPQGNKFAVTSGMKCVPICHYEPTNNWWVSKHIKKHKSTVLTVAWSPNNKLIVTGSSDYKCRIFSAFVKQVDSDSSEDSTIFPDTIDKAFGEPLAEFDHVSKAWVHSVAWSPNGSHIAFADHGSVLTFVELAAGSAHKVSTVNHKGLPFLDVKFLSDKALVGVGFDFNPTVFKHTGENWEYADVLDHGGDKPEKKAVSSAFAGAFSKFADKTERGVSDDQHNKSKVVETVLKTRHENTIHNCWIHSPTLISTSSLDGHVFFWDLTKSKLDLGALGLSS